MKKSIRVLSVLVIALLLFAGCSAGRKSLEHVFDFEGKQVKVVFDARGNWDNDYGSAAVYIYDGPNDGRPAIGHAYLINKDEYNTWYDEYSAYEGFNELENGFEFLNDEIDQPRYVYRVGDDCYFMITVSPDSARKPKEIYDRFEVSIVK